MPKEMELSKFPSSGIIVRWTKTARRLTIFGWYDSFVGIEGGSMTLREFFDWLGITEADCRKALKEKVDADRK